MAKKKKQQQRGGRHRIHPVDDCRRTMVRSTVAEEQAWHEAAAAELMTIGPWSRKVLNDAATTIRVRGESESPYYGGSFGNGGSIP